MIYASPHARTVSILGTGHVLPSEKVSSLELDKRLDLSPGTVERVGGVRYRHFASSTENAAQLGALACREALEAAGLTLDDIDCLVAASGTMDQGMPSNAALIHQALGLSKRGIPAFDINASCLGFLAALDTLSWPVMAGRYNRVLVVAADIASCGLNWNSLESSAIFGDGAAAAVIGAHRQSSSSILAAELLTLSEGADLCKIPAGGSRFHPTRTHLSFNALTQFHMNGQGVFRLAAKHLPGFVDRLLDQSRLGRNDLDWIVPHQGSQLALTHMTRRLGFATQKVVDIFSDHGNQVAASLPTALDIAIRDGRIRRGQYILLLGTGAGLSLGGIVLKY